MKGSRRAPELIPKLVFGLLIVTFILVYKFAYLNVWENTRFFWQDPAALSSRKENPNNLQLDFRYENITRPPSGYAVFNENCRIQQVDPFTPEVMRFYKPVPPMNCSYGEKLIVKQFDNKWKMYRLHTNVHLKRQYVSLDDEISCCYKEILRTGSGTGADNNYKLLPCIHFYQDFEVPIHIDGMLVQCKSVAYNKLVYQDAHFFIQERKDVRARLNDTNSSLKVVAFGVVLIGVDSISQINFRRTMPKTFKHLEQNNWFELSGYNKMGDNTFPNLMALMTGLNLTRSYEVCKPTQIGGLNNCSTLFNLFRQNGFATAYAEDEPLMSSFNYLKVGFHQPPTDYYLRPFTMATIKTLPIREQSGLSFCIGLRRAAEYIYDFGLEFADRFLTQRTFGLFWTNSFSHNSYADPSGMDIRMTDYFKELRSRGILDHSVVIFFSDHGSRWGQVRNLPQGFLEERLPLFFIWLPEWMRLKYPEFVHALRVNRHRLTSPYDIYMTLKHLLSLSKGGTSDIVGEFGPAEGCTDCQSLLRSVPENRSCQDAGIDEHWCTCKAYNAVSIYSKDMQDITQLVIDKMNLFLQNQTFADLCSKLTLRELVEANEKAEVDAKEHTKIEDGTLYRIRFNALPNDAEFEATFKYYKNMHSITVDVSSISRLNTYATDSACINDKISKKYCICK